MKKLPEKVQKHIAHLDNYVENEELNQFYILHLYPKKLAYPNGFYDSKWINIVGYNWISKDDKITNMEKRDLGSRYDGIKFTENVKVDIVRIFADGSTLIRFKSPVFVSGWFQEIEFDS